MHAVLLQADHPSLPAAELEALRAVHGGRVTAQIGERIHVIDEAAPLAAMVHALEWGDHWGTWTLDEGGIEAAAQTVAERAPGGLRAAVRSRRYGHDKPGGMGIERRLGAALVAAGHAIDLDSPEMVVFAWLGDDRITIGRRRGRLANFEDRISERRAHFSPVGMHPRRAAGLVHLARVAPGGRILDPFCGTGGIVLEAAIMGYDAIASDLDPQMVQGTLTTLTDAGLEPVDAQVFQADIGDVPKLVDGIDGIVTDLPYGGASSTHDEAIQDLYERAMAAFAQMLPVGGRAVIGHARPELLARASAHGLQRREHHAEYVHGSLTRYFSVFERVDEGAGPTVTA